MERDRWETIQECAKSSGLSIGLLRDLARAGMLREKDVLGTLYISVGDLAKVIADATKRRV
jgi:hypothetical protein